MLRNIRTAHRNGKGRVSIRGGFDHSLANTVDVVELQAANQHFVNISRSLKIGLKFLLIPLILLLLPHTVVAELKHHTP